MSWYSFHTKLSDFFRCRWPNTIVCNFYRLFIFSHEFIFWTRRRLAWRLLSFALSTCSAALLFLIPRSAYLEGFIPKSSTDLLIVSGFIPLFNALIRHQRNYQLLLQLCHHDLKPLFQPCYHFLNYNFNSYQWCWKSYSVRASLYNPTVASSSQSYS